MTDLFLGMPNGSPLLTRAQIRGLVSAAAEIDHPLARAVEICGLVPVPVAALCAAPVALVDRQRRTMRVDGGCGRSTDIALGTRAWTALERAIGDRCGGSIVAGNDGESIVIDQDAEETAVEMIARIPAGRVGRPWWFELVQLSIVVHLRKLGVPERTIMAQTADHPFGAEDSTARGLMAQQASSEMWAACLKVEGSRRASAAIRLGGLSIDIAWRGRIGSGEQS